MSGCGSAIGQGPVHREYQEINKMINETMGSKNIYSGNRNIRVSCVEIELIIRFENARFCFFCLRFNFDFVLLFCILIKIIRIVNGT